MDMTIKARYVGKKPLNESCYGDDCRIAATGSIEMDINGYQSTFNCPG
jgi:hypothetical protein